MWFTLCYHGDLAWLNFFFCHTKNWLPTQHSQLSWKSHLDVQPAVWSAYKQFKPKMNSKPVGCAFTLNLVFSWFLDYGLFLKAHLIPHSPHLCSVSLTHHVTNNFSNRAAGLAEVPESAFICRTLMKISTLFLFINLFYDLLFICAS